MPRVIHRTTLEVRESADEAEHPLTDWLWSPDLTLVQGVPHELWILDADGVTVREMTTPEKDARVAAFRATRKAALYEAVNAYGASHYDERTEMRLKHLYNRAVNDGLTDRAAHILDALNWSDAVIADWFARNAALDAATTYAQLVAVSLDFSNHDASDPNITVSTAMAITT